MLVSCTVLAIYSALLYIPLAGHLSAGYVSDNVRRGCGALMVGLTTFIILVQFLIPLAICWWFMRRKHDQGRLEVAS